MRRQGHRKRTTKLATVQPTLAVPPPPRDLLAWTRDAWIAFWSSDVAHALHAVDVAAVQVYFHTLDEWELCRRAARRKPIVPGSMGQPRINPLADRADRLAAMLPRLAAEIGASPLGRSKLAIDMGKIARTIEELNRDAEQVDDRPDPRLAALQLADQDG